MRTFGMPVKSLEFFLRLLTWFGGANLEFEVGAVRIVDQKGRVHYAPLKLFQFDGEQSLVARQIIHQIKDVVPNWETFKIFKNKWLVRVVYPYSLACHGWIMVSSYRACLAFGLSCEGQYQKPRILTLTDSEFRALEFGIGRYEANELVMMGYHGIRDGLHLFSFWEHECWSIGNAVTTDNGYDLENYGPFCGTLVCTNITLDSLNSE